jgi:hypothetical protein
MEKKKTAKKWSQQVTEHSHALSLEDGVFTKSDPDEIAASLARSAKASTQRKAGAFRSALSMLTFYINRAGKSLPAAQKRTLEKAKDKLRQRFHKS